jgi:AraC family transcriptional regulator, arabinose operon regulatory protein
MRSAPKQTKIFLSLFHTPTELSREIFYCVLRAGHLISGRDYKKVHPNYPGHKILLCLKGQGFIRHKDRTWPVDTGQIAWIYNDQDTAHWPVDGSPWEMYWIRVDGPHMDHIYKVLTTAGSPVFGGIQPKRAAAIYKRIFRIMTNRPMAMEAALHAEVASLMQELFTSRHAAIPSAAKKEEIPRSLHKPIEAMRLNFNLPLRVAQLFRNFKAATGTSPIDWLKRERINQAKKRLIETDDTIAEIAEATGYYDQFYFSRDFKRMTGVAPSEYRARERAHKKLTIETRP